MAIAAYNDTDSLEDLRRTLTRRLGFVLIGFGVFAAWYLLIRRDIPLSASGLMCLLVILGRSVQSALLTNATAARRLLVGGIVGLLAAGMLIFHNTWLPWLALPCIFISAILINNGSVFVSVGLLALAVLLNVIVDRNYPLTELASVMALATVSSWLSAYTLFTAVHWYGAMQARSEKLLEETRNHRAELTQTLKSLEAAYETQRHIQLELIWARKQAEDGRRLKEQFAANISHELRTPLNLILGFSEIMYRSPEVYGDTDWSPRLRRDVHQIYRSSQHLLNLIDDILDLSRFDMAAFSLSLELVAPEQFLQETIEIASDLVRGRPVELRLDIPGELPMVEIDCTRIRQVILNLLSNACSFTESGKVELSARTVNREILISVSDTGAGIPKDKLPYLFDEFYQVDPSLRRGHAGAGLGLAISKHFVEAHGGHIWVESSEGVGTCFTFSLPVTERYTGVTKNQGAVPQEHMRSRVLVIEKDLTIISMIRRYLRDCDVFQIKDAESIYDASLKYHPQAIIHNKRPGNHTLNIQDALETAIPVIECSLPGPTWIAQDLAIEGYLTKPVLAQTLLEEINRLDNVQNILVIDDDRGFTLLVERILQSSGLAFELRRAYDGVQGLTAIRERQPDLILLDIAMPGLDGLSLLAQLKATPEFARIPVILLTVDVGADNPPVQNWITVTHRDGLYPIEVFGCLNGIVKALRPRYSAGGMFSADKQNVTV